MAITGFAQTGDEKAIRQFIADYDQAYLNQNIGFIEANYADEYMFSDAYGGIKNRAQAIDEAKKEKAAPTEKTVSFKSVTDSVRVVGNAAIASGSWEWSGVPINDLSAEPHTDKGRFTLFF